MTQQFFDRYPEFSDQDPRIRRTEGYQPRRDLLETRYRSLLPPERVRGRRIVDVGSCVASVGAWCMAHGAEHYTGIELQADLALLSEKLLYRYWPKDWSIHCLDAQQWCLENREPHDICLIAGTLHTVDDPWSLMRGVVQWTNEVIVENSHPHVFAEMLNRTWRPAGIQHRHHTLLHHLLEQHHDKQTFREMLESLMPIQHNRHSDTLFMSKDLQSSTVSGNATYPGIGALNEFMTNHGYQVDLAVNDSLKRDMPDLYHWPARFAVRYHRSEAKRVKRFSDHV